ncbi:MAG: type VI secretion protein, partial [Pseudoxanthomonas suwonensis]
GVGAVIPNLLTFEESLMVLDIKQEAFDLTSGWRSQYGPVYLLNPFAEDLRTHRWNPLTYVSTDPKFRITDLQAIAAILYEDDPQRDSFWTNQARNCFLAASLYLCETLANDQKEKLPEEYQHVPTLGRIYRLFSGDGSDLKEFLKKLATRDWLSKDCKTAFSNLTSLADQTFTSVIGSFQEPLHIFLNPILDAATSDDDFDLRKLRRQKMTVYVGITPNKLAEARKLLNLFFSQAININTQQLPEKDPSLKYQCLLLLDEFTSIGRVDIIAHAISYLAGYNMRVFCVIQSLSQLDATYGPEVARTMVTNMACQVVYTPREQRDANEYSEMLGYTTLRRRTRTTSHGQSGSVSYAEVEERRALMLPQELKALSPEEEIIFVEGIAHPIKCSKIRYYKDGFFKARLKEKAPVKTLDLGGEPKQETND